MPKYKVKHTSIMHNKTVYAEGSEIELNEEQAERLSDFLTPVSGKKESAEKKSAEKTPKTTKTAQKKSEPEKSSEKASEESGTGGAE
jgi:hypothetical protein